MRSPVENERWRWRSRSRSSFLTIFIEPDSMGHSVSAIRRWIRKRYTMRTCWALRFSPAWRATVTMIGWLLQVSPAWSTPCGISGRMARGSTQIRPSRNGWIRFTRVSIFRRSATFSTLDWRRNTGRRIRGAWNTTPTLSSWKTARRSTTTIGSTLSTSMRRRRRSVSSRARGRGTAN